VAKASVDEIYNQLHSASGYHPFTASTFADWSIEAGDIVQVTRDGETYQAPVHSTQMAWKGQPQVSMNSSGNKEKESVAVMSSKKLTESTRSGNTYRSGKHRTSGIQENNEAIILERTERTEGDNILSGKLTVTSREIRAEMVDTANGLTSLISVTAKQIRSEVTDVQNGLQSSITQTASQIRAEVNNTAKGLQSSITQQANRISLVVEGTGANAKIKPAGIVASINNASSSICISADHIRLDGQTRMNDVLTISDGMARFLKPVACGTSFSNLVSISNGNVAAFKFSWKGTGSEYYTVDASDFGGMIKAASKSGNTLTLTKWNGETLSFSRAITSWTWGGGSGKINVTALPQDQTKSVNVSIDGTSSITSNGTYTYTVDYENSSGDDVSTGATKTVTVNVPSSGGDISIYAPRDSYNSQPSGTTQIWANFTFTNNKWYQFRVTCGSSEKWYAVKVQV
jgi:hypothetical protein